MSKNSLVKTLKYEDPKVKLADLGKFSISSVLIALLFLVIPIEHGLVFLDVGSSFVTYLIFLIDFIVVCEILKKPKLPFNDTIIVSFIFLVYSFILLIPDLTLYYEPGRAHLSLINAFVMFLLYSFNSYKEEEVRLFAWGAAASGLLVSIVVINTINLSEIKDFGRLFLSLDATIDPNFLSTNFCIAFSAFFELFFFYRKTSIRIFILFLASNLAFVLFILASRGAMLGMMAIIISNVFFRCDYLKYKSSFRNASLVVLLTILVFSYFIVFDLIPPSMFERYSLSVMVESKGTGRIPIYKRALDNYLNNLTLKETLFGTGFGTYLMVSPTKEAAHNIYINVLVELGVVGLFIFLVFIFKSLRNAYARRNCFAFSALLGLCICGLSLDICISRVLWLGFWLCNLDHNSLKCSCKSNMLLKGTI